VSPFSPMRIVLEKQVILAFVPDQTIGIIHPIFGRGEMQAWTVLAV